MGLKASLNRGNGAIISQTKSIHKAV